MTEREYRLEIKNIQAYNYLRGGFSDELALRARLVGTE